MTNKKGFPVLPKSVQQVIKQFFQIKVQFVIEGRNMGHDYCYYQQYLDHLAQQEDLEIQSDPLRKYATGKKNYRFFCFFLP